MLNACVFVFFVIVCNCNCLCSALFIFDKCIHYVVVLLFNYLSTCLCVCASVLWCVYSRYCLFIAGVWASTFLTTAEIAIELVTFVSSFQIVKSYDSS